MVWGQVLGRGCAYSEHQSDGQQRKERTGKLIHPNSS
jgi:hypothetical protein